MLSDSLRSKAAVLASDLARKAALKLDAFANEQLSSRVVYRPHMHFEAVKSPQGLTLSYPLQGLAVGELAISHDHISVYATITPANSEFVVGSLQSLPEPNLTDDQDVSIAKIKALKWDSVTEEELKQAFRIYANCGVDAWIETASELAALLLAVAIDLRGGNQEGLRSADLKKYHLLDELVKIAVWGHLSPAVFERLNKFLEDIPGFSHNDVLGGKIKDRAYESYGVLTMNLAHVFHDPGYERPERPYRVADAVVKFECDRPIESASARVEGANLVVDVLLIEDRIRDVSIRS